MWSPAVFGRLPANVGSALAAVRRGLLRRIPAPDLGQRTVCDLLGDPLSDPTRIFARHPIDFGGDDRSSARVERGIW